MAKQKSPEQHDDPGPRPVTDLHEHYLSDDDPLLAEKIRFLRAVREEYTPPSVAIMRRVTSVLKIPNFPAILIVCFCPYFVGAALVLLQGGDLTFHTTFWLRLNIYMITVGAFVLLDFIYHKSIKVASEIAYPISSLEDLERIRRAYALMLAGKGQYVLYSIFCVILVFTIIFLLKLPFSGAVFIFYLFYAVSSILLMLGGVWFTIGISYLAYNYSKCRSIRFSLLHPIETIGVRYLSELSTTWAMCFVLEAVFIIFGLWACPWGAEGQVIFYASGFWTMFVIFLTLETIIFPKVMIRNLVNTGKQIRAHWFLRFVEEYEEGMPRISREEIETKEKALNLLREYNDIYKSIVRAPTSSIDFSTLVKLGGSLLIPLLIFVLQNFENVKTLLTELRRLI